MDFTDEQIEFMREDLDSGMQYTKMIEATKKRFKEEGRDFDVEFAVYKEKRRLVVEKRRKEWLKKQAQQYTQQTLRKWEIQRGY